VNYLKVVLSGRKEEKEEMQELFNVDINHHFPAFSGLCGREEKNTLTLSAF
jgi:hypothetical protein